MQMAQSAPAGEHAAVGQQRGRGVVLPDATGAGSVVQAPVPGSRRSAAVAA